MSAAAKKIVAASSMSAVTTTGTAVMMSAQRQSRALKALVNGLCLVALLAAVSTMFSQGITIYRAPGRGINPPVVFDSGVYKVFDFNNFRWRYIYVSTEAEPDGVRVDSVVKTYWGDYLAVTVEKDGSENWRIWTRERWEKWRDRYGRYQSS